MDGRFWIDLIQNPNETCFWKISSLGMLYLSMEWSGGIIIWKYHNAKYMRTPPLILGESFKILLLINIAKTVLDVYTCVIKSAGHCFIVGAGAICCALQMGLCKHAAIFCWHWVFSSYYEYGFNKPRMRAPDAGWSQIIAENVTSRYARIARGDLGAHRLKYYTGKYTYIHNENNITNTLVHHCSRRMIYQKQPVHIVYSLAALPIFWK